MQAASHDRPLRAVPVRRQRPRDAVDWRAVYAEALRVKLGGGRPEAATFVVPFEESRDLMVLMVPCPRRIVRQVRGVLERVANVVDGAGGLLAFLGRRITS